MPLSGSRRAPAHDRLWVDRGLTALWTTRLAWRVFAMVLSAPDHGPIIFSRASGSRRCMTSLEVPVPPAMSRTVSSCPSRMMTAVAPSPDGRG